MYMHWFRVINFLFKYFCYFCIKCVQFCEAFKASFCNNNNKRVNYTNIIEIDLRYRPMHFKLNGNTDAFRRNQNRITRCNRTKFPDLWLAENHLLTEGSGVQFKLKFKRLSLKNWPNNGPKTGTFSSKWNINMSSRYAYAGCKNLQGF